MADNFGLKLGIEGEKEFKKSLAEINQTFKVLGSEMKLVSSQFDKNDNSIQALSARNTVLNKEIDAQKQKIETLRQALANASESFGETDRRTQSWQIQLNNAEASLNSMERELDSNNSALEQAKADIEGTEKSLERVDGQLDDAADSAMIWAMKSRTRVTRRISQRRDFQSLVRYSRVWALQWERLLLRLPQLPLSLARRL